MLLDEIGPAHKKIFFVSLKLGIGSDNEETFTANSTSIKKAQHAAAEPGRVQGCGADTAHQPAGAERHTAIALTPGSSTRPFGPPKPLTNGYQTALFDYPKHGSSRLDSCPHSIRRHDDFRQRRGMPGPAQAPPHPGVRMHGHRA